MISSISIEGYKCIDKLEMELSNFTLLAGVNSGGKSSIIKMLIFMNDFVRYYCDSKSKSMSIASLGSFKDIRNNVIGTRIISSVIKYSDNIEDSYNALIREDAASDYATLTEDKERKNPVSAIPKVIHLSIDRIGVEQSYKLNMMEGFDIGKKGEYIFSILAKYGHEALREKAFLIDDENVGQSFNNQVNYWLEYITGFHIKASPIEEIDQVSVSYSAKDTMSFYKPSNVGTGISYLAELVICALSCKKEDVLVIENPEIHLHPKAQSKFMEFIAFLSKKGLQIIIETHSDHIYNGMRKCVKRGLLDKEEISTYFLELNKDKLCKMSKIIINDYGAEENHPNGMFDQFEDDLDELIGI